MFIIHTLSITHLMNYLPYHHILSTQHHHYHHHIIIITITARARSGRKNIQDHRVLRGGEVPTRRSPGHKQRCAPPSPSLPVTLTCVPATTSRPQGQGHQQRCVSPPPLPYAPSPPLYTFFSSYFPSVTSPPPYAPSHTPPSP